VLPEPGFLDGIRQLATDAGTLLIIDETHTFSAGPGGMTQRDRLAPDIVVIGKSIGGGLPSGAYGLSDAVAGEVRRRVEAGEADIVDVGGVGGTLAGNALSLAAMRATLGEILTPQAFEHMISLAARYTDGVAVVIAAAGLPWSVSQLGARAEYRFASPAPRTGGESAAAADTDLDEYVHLYTINRGILLTPFHNMALMCPTTTTEDVDAHLAVFADAVAELTA
jgi:glutamate-1-semialdehyde 2,1-aminomutase